MLKISRQDLCSAVQTVISGAARKAIIQWHDMLLFECTGERVIIAAGSAQGFVWRSFEAAGPQFRVAVKAKEISEVCSACRSDTLTITQEGNKLTMLGERGRLGISCSMTMPEIPDGWPSLPEVPDEEGFTVQSGRLAYAMRSTVPMTDENSDKYTLGAVNFVADGNMMHCYATNGRAAVSAQAVCENPSGERYSFLLQDAGVAVLAGMLRGLGDNVPVSVRRCGNSAAFVTPDAVAVIVESAGRFPAVDRVISEKIKSRKAATFRVASSDLKSALREAVIGYDVASDRGRTVLVVSDGKRVRILSNAHSDNDMDVLVPSQEASGEGGAIKIDHAYLSKLCGSVGESVQAYICEGSTILMTNEETGFSSVLVGCEMDPQNAARAERAMQAGESFLFA